MRPIILISESDGFSRTAEAQLRTVSIVSLADCDRKGLLAKVQNAHVLWVRLRHRIDMEVMDAAPHLQAIATATTGLNHIDSGEAHRRGITIISLQGEGEFLRNVTATAEHTVALILAAVRRVPAASRDVARGNWNRDIFLGRDLHGMTAGIVGYGRLGRMVARYLRTFGMRIYATDPFASRGSVEDGVKLTSLNDLLATSDVVTLHVNLSDSTRRFFGKREFAVMKPGSWFINTARGELIDEDALHGTLKTGHIAGAALDVLSDEQSSGMSHHQLVRYAQIHENLLITPHIGGCTIESREKTECFLASRVVDFLRAQTGANSRGGGNKSHRHVPHKVPIGNQN